MNGVRVGDLVSQLRSRSRVVTARIGDVELVTEGDYAGMLRVGDEYLSWGARNTQMLIGFLKGPGYKYVLNQDLDWQRKIVRHHTDMRADNMSVWHVDGTSITGIYHPEDKIIPLVSVAEQIADVFGPDDQVEVLKNPDQVELNVFSAVRTVTVPGIPGIPDRPLEGTVDHPALMKVGDLSAGGVRVIIQPGKPERAPVVEENWWRCFCDNQMTRRISGSQINLRGRTVDEILTEMNNVMRVVWEGLDGSAQAIQHSAEIPIPGTIPDFIRVVARERGINAATVLKLQERAAALHGDPSIYDVTQIITAMANEESLPTLTRRNLQAIGGDLTINTVRMVHRCPSCESPLAA